jgi:hypothetical protein
MASIDSCSRLILGFVFLSSFWFLRCFLVFVNVLILGREASCCILLGVGEYLRIHVSRLVGRGSWIAGFRLEPKGAEEIRPQ